MTFNKLISRYDVEDVLRLVGLARRRSALGVILPALGLLAAGAAIGAGAGLAFAPSSGRRLRQDVGGKLDQIRERVVSKDKEKETPRYNDVNASS